MFRSLSLWQQPKGISAAVNSKETISKFLLKTNENFKILLNRYSWFVYFIASCLILCSIYYYFYDYKKRLSLRRQRENLQRASERITQRRRPGAIHRDHEIFRNALRTVRQFISPNGIKGSKDKSHVLKRTRSGLIYGSFSDTEDN